jgi:hypothetical protein
MRQTNRMDAPEFLRARNYWRYHTMRGLKAANIARAENPTQIAAENPSLMYIGKRSDTRPQERAEFPLPLHFNQICQRKLNAASNPMFPSERFSCQAVARMHQPSSPSFRLVSLHDLA